MATTTEFTVTLANEIGKLSGPEYLARQKADTLPLAFSRFEEILKAKFKKITCRDTGSDEFQATGNLHEVRYSPSDCLWHVYFNGAHGSGETFDQADKACRVDYDRIIG